MVRNSEETVSSDILNYLLNSDASLSWHNMTTPSEEIITARRLTILPTLTMTHRLTTHRAIILEDVVSINQTLCIVVHGKKTSIAKTSIYGLYPRTAYHITHTHHDDNEDDDEGEEDVMVDITATSSMEGVLEFTMKYAKGCVVRIVCISSQ
jgi:hypothetical protein